MHEMSPALHICFCHEANKGVKATPQAALADRDAALIAVGVVLIGFSFRDCVGKNSARQHFTKI